MKINDCREDWLRLFGSHRFFVRSTFSQCDLSWPLSRWTIKITLLTRWLAATAAIHIISAHSFVLGRCWTFFTISSTFSPYFQCIVRGKIEYHFGPNLDQVARFDINKEFRGVLHANLIFGLSIYLSLSLHLSLALSHSLSLCDGLLAYISTFHTLAELIRFECKRPLNRMVHQGNKLRSELIMWRLYYESICSGWDCGRWCAQCS